MNEAEKRQNEYINQTAERVENRYDFKKAEKDAYRLKKGLTPKIVEELSAKKNRKKKKKQAEKAKSSLKQKARAKSQ